MYRKLLICTAALLLVLNLNAFPADAQTSSESVVIGRLTGTLHKPPHSLLGNSRTVGGDRGSVEIRGYKLIRESDGRTFGIRPLMDGYFQQSLPPGEYSLVRQRRDRPSYREDKRIDILSSFVVPAGSLVNLGTIEIVLLGKPEETVFRPSRPSRGTYVYRYRYSRSDSEEALFAPLGWFREKKGATAAKYSENVVTVDDKPADITDSSRFDLRENVFRLPLIHEP